MMKTKTKKITAVMMSALLMVGLAACGNGQQAADDGTAAPSSETADQEGAGAGTATEAAGETETESEAGETAGGKTLVVYYSASGNTKKVAGYIAAATGGELFELEPTEPYTDENLDWTNEDSRVSREHDNEGERNVALVSAEIPDWDSYETVFIGYPIWWGIAAWPVDGFITANDFTGKTVIPFCTSASSGLGESGRLLEKMAGTGDWQEGQRFSSGVSEEDVTTWAESLG